MKIMMMTTTMMLKIMIMMKIMKMMTMYIEGDQDHNMAAISCTWITCKAPIYQTQVYFKLMFKF